MSDSEEKVAGRPPAVKAGGMRIVQHKTGHSTPGKDPVEMVGLSNPPPNVQSEVAALSTSPNTKNSIEASQVAHHKIEKPQVHAKPTVHIQQPRK